MEAVCGCVVWSSGRRWVMLGGGCGVAVCISKVL